MQPGTRRLFASSDAKELCKTENYGRPIPCSEKQTDYNKTIHNLRGSVSIINNAVPLSAFVGDEKDQMVMLDIIQGNLITLEMTVERLVRQRVEHDTAPTDIFTGADTVIVKVRFKQHQKIAE